MVCHHFVTGGSRPFLQQNDFLPITKAQLLGSCRQRSICGPAFGGCLLLHDFNS